MISSGKILIAANDPSFCAVECPKHKITMFQFTALDGTFWFCPKCKAPYELGLVKLKKWNKKALAEALKH